MASGTAVVAIGCCALLGVVFVVSAFGKLRSRDALRAFAVSVREMRVLPAGLSRPVAVTVPAAEAIAAALLLTPATATLGAGLALVLLGAFTFGIALVLSRGGAASCRCFGMSDRPFAPRHLVRNGLLIIAALAALVTSAGSTAEPHPVAALLAIVVGLVGALLIVVLDDLVELFGGAGHSIHR